MTAWPDEQRDAALELLRQGTPLPDVHRATGIPRRTLVDWAKKAGLTSSTQASEKTAQAREAAIVAAAHRRAQLARDLLDDVDRLRRQLFAPCVERKAMVVHQGKDNPAEVEIVDIERGQPTFDEQRAIMISIGIGVDKVLLLSGEDPAQAPSSAFRDELLAAARENGRHMQPVEAAG